MENFPKKHHYVPKYLLKNFGFGKKHSQIYVFDKTKSQSYQSSVINTGSENYFNCFEYEGRNINFEEVLQDIDGLGSVVVRKIVEEESIAHLTQEDLSNLVAAVSAQVLRTKIRRTSYVQLSKQLAERCREIGYAEYDLQELISFGDNESRRVAFRSLLKIDEIANLLLQKVTVLLFNKSLDKSIWISDNPVVMYNVFPYGHEGFAEKGVEVYFPISSNLCVGFYCPSIYLQLKESFSPLHPHPSSQDPWLKEVLNGIETLQPIPVNKSIVHYLNELQIRSSSRFIYSQVNDFEVAVNYLSKNPEIKEVTSEHRLGKFGEMPPVSKDFPSGEFVVFHGCQNHHILPVFDVKPEKVAFRFTTSDNLKLKYIERDAPFSRVEYYVNGQLVQLYSEVTVERLLIQNVSGQPQARIKYIDEGLNQLFEKIDG